MTKKVSVMIKYLLRAQLKKIYSTSLQKVSWKVFFQGIMAQFLLTGKPVQERPIQWWGSSTILPSKA